MGIAILYCAPEGARGLFGEGTPSKITQYILRNKYTKFGAFDRSVMIKTITDWTIHALIITLNVPIMLVSCVIDMC